MGGLIICSNPERWGSGAAEGPSGVQGQHPLMGDESSTLPPEADESLKINKQGKNHPPDAQ